MRKMKADSIADLVTMAAALKLRPPRKTSTIELETQTTAWHKLAATLSQVLETA